MHKDTTHPVLTCLFLGLVFWLPIPLGSDRAWAWSLMELWVFLIAIIIFFISLKNKTPIPIAVHAAKPILFLLAATLLWTGIQIIPLPISVLDILSPHAAKFAMESSQANYASISLDPELTAKALLKGLAYFTIMIIMLILINNKQKIRWFAYTVLAAGLFQATYGSYMILSGVEYTFFFEKEAYRGRATGTFIDRSHLAGYLEMVLAIGIGLLISYLKSEKANGWREKLRRLFETILGPKALIRLSLIIICIGLILSKSRLGNTAFFASLLISGVFFLLTARHATRSTAIFLTSLIILDILLIGSWFGVEHVVERIENTTMVQEQRDEVDRDTLTMLYDFPVTGIGGGNYSSFFPNYQGMDSMGEIYHARNDYLEFAVEYGAIGFILFSSAVLYSWIAAIKAIRKRNSPLYLGMAFASFMGILSILIHSVGDFNL